MYHDFRYAIIYESIAEVDMYHYILHVCPGIAKTQQNIVAVENG